MHACGRWRHLSPAVLLLTLLPCDCSDLRCREGVRTASAMLLRCRAPVVVHGSLGRRRRTDVLAAVVVLAVVDALRLLGGGVAQPTSACAVSVLSGASIGTACWRQGRAARASVVHRVLALRARRVCLFGVWSAVTHLLTRLRRPFVVLAAAAAVAAPAARRTDQDGRERQSICPTLEFATCSEQVTFALRSPRPGPSFPSSRPRKSRVPLKPGNAGL